MNGELRYKDGSRTVLMAEKKSSPNVKSEGDHAWSKWLG